MHAFTDKTSVAVTALLMGSNKWFHADIESPGFEDQLRSIAMAVPAIGGEGFYEVEAACPTGRLDPAFHIVKWLGLKYPTIIYHHGNNEHPFDYGFKAKNTFQYVLYKNKDEIDANIISLRAPFHNNGLRHYFVLMSRLVEFTAMLSASVRLTEGLVQMLKSNGCPRVAVTGISLGGWVVNLHRTFYNSAHVYIPIFAGASLGELFLTSCYQKLTGDLAKENPGKIRACLNFDDAFAKAKDDNVFPLMARLDQFVEFDMQKPCYEGRNIAVLEKGHITGALAFKELREHILAAVFGA